jgi:hypothetical protein
MVRKREPIDDKIDAAGRLTGAVADWASDHRLPALGAAFFISAR